MNTNVNFAAPLGVLAFLGTGLVLVVALLLLLYSLIVRRWGRVKIVMLAMIGIGVVYFGLVLFFSLLSRDKVLAWGQEKHFCEIDCHLAYSISEARQVRT